MNAGIKPLLTERNSRLVQYIRQIITSLHKHIMLIEALREDYGCVVFSIRQFDQTADRIIADCTAAEIFKYRADLLNSCIIRHAPRREGMYQLDRRVSRFLNEMAEQESIGLSGNIRVEVEQLSELLQQLADAVSRNDKLNSDRYLEQMDLRLSNLQTQSSVNEKAILRAVEKSKSYPPSYTIKQRYKQANDLWDQYIIPMLEMIEPHGLFNRTLTELERELREYRRDGRLMLVSQRTVIEQVMYRILDLRGEMSSSIQRSQIKLAPLKEAYRKASYMSRSIANALKYLANQRFRYANDFPIPNIGKKSTPALTDGDAEIDGYLSGLVDYSPATVYLPSTENNPREAPVLYPDVLDVAFRQVPIDDTFSWLIKTYPELTTNYLLQLFLRLTSMEPKLHCAMKERNRYRTSSHIITMPIRQLLLKPTEEVAVS